MWESSIKDTKNNAKGQVFDLKPFFNLVKYYISVVDDYVSP